MSRPVYSTDFVSREFGVWWVDSGWEVIPRAGRRIEGRRRERRARLIDVLHEAVGQCRLDAQRRVPDEIEHAVVLVPVVANAEAGADSRLVIAETIPRDAQAGPGMAAFHT